MEPGLNTDTSGLYSECLFSIRVLAMTLHDLRISCAAITLKMRTQRNRKHPTRQNQNQCASVR